MKKITLLLFALPLYSALAQTPDISWQKTYGGPDIDSGTSIAATSDGGYIVAGSAMGSGGDITTGYGYIDYWVVKLDPDGNLIWQKSFGGSLNEIPFKIITCDDGGYLIVGYSNSYDGDVSQNFGQTDVWIIKLDDDGVMLWEKSYGGGVNEWATSVEQTSDGGYIVAGTTLSYDGDVTYNHGAEDVWILKLDATGTLLWEKTFGGSDTDGATGIKETTDGYVVAGYTQSLDGDVSGLHTIEEEEVTMGDYWVVALDFDGNMQWQRALGGYSNEFAFGIDLTEDDGYIITGTSDSNDGDVTGNHGSGDYWVTKLDSSGTLLWQKTYGGSAYEEARSIQCIPGNGYIIGGIAVSADGDVSNNHGSSDYWIVKIDEAGGLEWEKSIGGAAGDYCFEALHTGENDFIAVGYTYSSDGVFSDNNGLSDFYIVRSGIPLVATIHVDETNATEFCAGTAVETAVTTTGTYPDDNVFTLQLSDASGSFDNPITLYEYQATAVNFMAGIIPQDTPPGTEYRVRVISNNDETSVTDNGINLTINNPAAPQGAATQTITTPDANDATLSQLDVTGEAIAWYASETSAHGGTEELPATTVVIADTTYYATQTINGCEGFPLAVTVSVVLGSDSLNNTTFTYYPNPVTDALHINASQTMTSVSIINLIGQEVLNQSLNAENAIISTASLSAGTYLARISFGNSQQVIKIVKN